MINRETNFIDYWCFFLIAEHYHFTGIFAIGFQWLLASKFNQLLTNLTLHHV